MRVALVHDYLTQMGGAERVLLALHDLFPTAPIYTSIYAPAQVDARFRRLDVRPALPRGLPLVGRYARALLPLYPLLFESLDLRGFDLVLSDSSAFAKGVCTGPDALHVCYCHTPMRFAWSFEDYIERERLGGWARWLLRPTVARLRAWDVVTANRVDAFIANSPGVARRIAKYYRRGASVVPPPITVADFQVAEAPHAAFLVVARLAPYKRVDLAVRACAALGLPLRVVGTGRDLPRLRALAAPNVTFLGALPDAAVRRELACCRALIVPGEEDFGIVTLEAQASGRPVIAYGAGGALCTVVEGETGVFFREPTWQSLAGAIERFEALRFEPRAIRQHAEAFDVRHFHQRMRDAIATAWRARDAGETGLMPAPPTIPAAPLIEPAVSDGHQRALDPRRA